jgi:hypothetical protein
LQVHWHRHRKRNSRLSALQRVFGRRQTVIRKVLGSCKNLRLNVPSSQAHLITDPRAFDGAVFDAELDNGLGTEVDGPAEREHRTARHSAH